MKLIKLEKLVDSTFEKLLVPPKTKAELVDYVDFKLKRLMVK